MIILENGKEYGIWTLISFNSKVKRTYKSSHVKCKFCGFETEVSNSEILKQKRRCKKCKASSLDKRKKNISKAWLSQKKCALWKGSKLRGRRLKEWDISLDFLEDLLVRQNFKCPLSGEKLVGDMHYTELKNNPHKDNVNPYSRGNISIDRINPDLGYTKDNVRLTTKWANVMRNDSTDEELLQKCMAIVAHMSRK